MASMMKFSNFCDLESFCEFYNQLDDICKEDFIMEYFEDLLDIDGFDYLIEGKAAKKNSPVDKELWGRALQNARSKFDKYPSAYANLWACKWYKSHGGKWKKAKKESIDLFSTYENLRTWLKERWVRIGSDGSIKGACGTSKDTTNPDRCLPIAKAKSLTKAERMATQQKKKNSSKQFVKNTTKAEVKK